MPPLPSKKPKQKPSVKCVACEGTGKNSRGGECRPCDGTGKPKTRSK